MFDCIYGGGAGARLCVTMCRRAYASIQMTLYVGLHYIGKQLFHKIIMETNTFKLVIYYKPNNVLIATHEW